MSSRSDPRQYCELLEGTATLCAGHRARLRGTKEEVGQKCEYRHHRGSGVRGYKGARQRPRESGGASRQARGEAGAAGGTHQSLVHVRLRPFGRRRRVLGVAQTLAGRGDAASGSHGNTTQGDSGRRGVGYETAAGTN